MKLSEILVHQQGPLKKNFHLKSKRFNLIYGPNESGKTFIIEKLLEKLFPNDKRRLRTWSSQIPILVKTTRSLELIQSSEAKLSELLVVQAEETLISEPDKLVRKNLSKLGMLEDAKDKIFKDHRTILNSAYISNQEVHGNNTGLIQKFRNARDEKEKIERLREKHRKSDLDSKKLTEEVRELECKKSLMESARGFNAYYFSGKKKELENKISNFPFNRDLEKDKAKIESLQKAENSLRSKIQEKAKKQNQLKHEDWLRKVLDKNKKRENIRNIGFYLGAFLGFSLAIIDIFDVVDEQNWSEWFPGIAISISFFTLAIFYNFFGKIPNKQKKEYKEKFSVEDPINLSTFEDKISGFDRLKGEIVGIEKDISELQEEVEKSKKEILPILDNSQILKNGCYSSSIEALIEEKKSDESELKRISGYLEGLGDVEHVKEEPNVVWNQSEYNKLLEELQDVQSDLNSLDSDKDYKEIASELIALTCIKEAIDELQKQENEFISQKLLEKSEQLQFVVPGRFSRLSWDGENLMIEDSTSRIDYITGRPKKQRSQLATLSTGANEQLMLLLRKIFAEDYFDEESGFLLLDDAFQHSDWERRESLVDYILQLVEDHDWQIFYFSMDDHLATLIHERASARLGSDFAYKQLS